MIRELYGINLELRVKGCYFNRSSYVRLNVPFLRI